MADIKVSSLDSDSRMVAHDPTSTQAWGWRHPQVGSMTSAPSLVKGRT